ncbi:MAG: hypothetical protein JWP40_905 [Blastococcus sp.]|nr:hypothetical protein [Blastococcus sp.]
MQVINRVLATLLALALFLGGLLAALDIVLVQLQRPPFLVPASRWAAWLRMQSFNTGIVRAVCVGLILLGLVFLFCALRRGRPGALRLPGRTDGVAVTASRSGLERALSIEAGRVDGVRSARAKARRRRVKVIAATGLRDPGDLSTRIADVISERLGELDLADSLRSRVTVSSKGSR